MRLFLLRLAWARRGQRAGKARGAFVEVGSARNRSSSAPARNRCSEHESDDVLEAQQKLEDSE